MNKSELVDAIANKTGESKASVGRHIDATIEVITAAVAKGDDVALIGFGTFTSAKRAARNGRNPRSGEDIKIAARTNPVFKAGKAFKDAVNK